MPSGMVASIDGAQSYWGRGALGRRNQDTEAPFQDDGGIRQGRQGICAGNKRGCDEKQQKVRYNESHMAAVTDLAARSIPARATPSTIEEYALPTAGGPEHVGQDSPAVRCRRPQLIPHRLQESVPQAEGPQAIHIRGIRTWNLTYKTNKERPNAEV